MVGFKMGNSVRHGYGWGQGNVKWRIQDPRGFELEISSPNFAQIISFCTIEKGEILEECIWARLGKDNILVPVDSDVYRASARNTERMAKKASMRDLKIGDTAILHNGDEGVYYGTFYVTSVEKYNQPARYATTTGKKRHVFLMQTPGADGTSSRKFFKAIGSPKLSELVEGTRITHEEAEREVNRLIQSGVDLDESSANYHQPIAVSIEESKDLKFTRIEETTDYDTLVQRAIALQPEHKDNLNYLLRYTMPGTAFANFKGQPVIVPLYDWEAKANVAPGHKNHNPGYHTGPNYWLFRMPLLDAAEWSNGKIKVVEHQAKHGSGIWARAYNETKTVDLDPSVDTLPELIQFKMVAKTKSGTEVSYYI